MEVRGQLVGVRSLLLPYGAWGSNSGGQVWWQAPCPAEPSTWPTLSSHWPLSVPRLRDCRSSALAAHRQLSGALMLGLTVTAVWEVVAGSGVCATFLSAVWSSALCFPLTPVRKASVMGEHPSTAAIFLMMGSRIPMGTRSYRCSSPL